MAKVTYGQGISDMSGSIAGNTFSRNANGAFVRNRVKPTNPNTNKQIGTRASLSVIASGWRALTDAQRTAWAAAVDSFPYQDSLGQRKTYTGQQLYMKLNQQLLTAASGATLLTSPPAPFSFSAMLLTGITMTLTTGSLSAASAAFSAAASQSGTRVILYATPGLSAGIMRPQDGLFRKLGAFTVASSAANFLTAYTGIYPSPASGQKVFVRAVVYNLTTGQVIEAGQYSVLIA